MLEHFIHVVFLVVASTTVGQPYHAFSHTNPNPTVSAHFHGISAVPCFVTMSTAGKEDTSLSDLLSFMKQSEENRKIEMKALEEKLVSERVNDKNELSKDIGNLTETLTELVKTGVKDEIEAAVKPIEEKQNALIDDQKFMLNEQTKLAKKVLELERKLESTNHSNENNDAGQTELNVVSGEPSLSKQDDDTTLRTKTIKAARKILGFSKITVAHIQQAVKEHDLDPNDDAKAKVWAIYDFLYYEMKIPDDEIKAMNILRTFRPARKPDSDTLYAEFVEETSVNLINQYTRNLQPGTNVDIWIPPTLFQRFRDFDHAKYMIRKGPGNFKAKIKYGDTDFILMKKSPSCPSWSNVVPDVLSPLDPSPPAYINPSSSPPIGRNSRSKRKERSPLASPSRSKSLRVGESEDENKEASSNTVTADVDRDKDPKGPVVGPTFATPSLN